MRKPINKREYCVALEQNIFGQTAVIRVDHTYFGPIYFHDKKFKQFLKKKASFALTANNFLDKYINMKTELSGTNFAISNYRQMPFRSFGFNFTYKFGKMEFKNEQKGEDSNMMSPPGVN